MAVAGYRRPDLARSLRSFELPRWPEPVKATSFINLFLIRHARLHFVT